MVEQEVMGETQKALIKDKGVAARDEHRRVLSPTLDATDIFCG